MRKISPPTLMLACLLGMMNAHWLFPIPWISSWGLLIVGIGFITLGLVIAFGAEKQFRQSNTTVDHLGMASRLVQDGWYKYSRNPMYFSFVLVLMGAWLLLGSLSPLAFILLFILLTEQWYILPEERRLAAAFGNVYGSYLKHTRRWI
jgi:protein-S-isoprenylcysteine O-methyltransferase Ste14